MNLTYDTHIDNGIIFIKNIRENNDVINVTKSLKILFTSPVEMHSSNFKFFSSAKVKAEITSTKLNEDNYNIVCEFTEDNSGPFVIHTDDTIHINFASADIVASRAKLENYIHSIILIKDEEMGKLTLKSDPAPSEGLENMPLTLRLWHEKSFFDLLFFKIGHDSSYELAPRNYNIKSLTITDPKTSKRWILVFEPNEFIIKIHHPITIKVSYKAI